jgi:hypothetical protein
MGALDLIARLSALGLRLTREGDGIRVAPRSALTDEARDLIRSHKAELLAALADPELFTFAPPGDPANDAEAVAERAAIMAEANGWDDARALQEARWQADRERCWRAFLRNAERILAAPEGYREALLARYRAEAERRYCEHTARDMALSLASWVRARAMH